MADEVAVNSESVMKRVKEIKRVKIGEITIELQALKPFTRGEIKKFKKEHGLKGDFGKALSEDDDVQTEFVLMAVKKLMPACTAEALDSLTNTQFAAVVNAVNRAESVDQDF